MLKQQTSYNGNGSNNIFPGFLRPTTTPVPDEVFDLLMHQVSHAELRVLLYIIRRTFGFKKDKDNISLSQMVNGIKTKDGKVLDGGTGLARSGVAKAIKGLADKGIIVATRNSSPEKGNEPTTYALRFMHDPLSTSEDTPSPQNGPTTNSITRNRTTRFCCCSGSASKFRTFG